MSPTLRRVRLLGGGIALALALAACGSGSRDDAGAANFDGSARMSRPVFPDFAAQAPDGASSPSLPRREGTLVRSAPPLALNGVREAAPLPGAWSRQPSWSTIGPPPLADDPWAAAPPQEAIEAYYPEPASQPEPDAPAGLVVATLLESVIDTASRRDSRRPPRWRSRDHRRGDRHDRHPPPIASHRPGDPRLHDDRPRRWAPPVAGADPGRPTRPGPARPEEPAQSLPRELPLVRAPAADLALESARPPIARAAREAPVAVVDRGEIRAAREAVQAQAQAAQAQAQAHRETAARLASAQRDQALRLASVQREAEDRLAQAARQEEAQRQGARVAEVQRARAAEAHRASAEQQARAESEARLREQRQAQALARRDDPPAVQQPQPQPQAADAPPAELARFRGPAARLADLEERPQARGKPMAGAGAD